MESLDKLSWYMTKHATNESMNNVILIDDILVHDFWYLNPVRVIMGVRPVRLDLSAESAAIQ
jgi:hypothetical protein